MVLKTNHIEDAITLAESAASLHGAPPYVHHVLGEVLLAAGRPADALAPLSKALASGAAEPAFLQGQAHFALSRFDDAAAAYRIALDIDPEHSVAANNILPALLGSGADEEALMRANQVLARTPYQASMLAFKAIALANLGKNDDARALGDRETLLETGHITSPSGYASLSDFNAALAVALQREKDIMYEPPGNATRRGYQVRNLGSSTEPAIQMLNSLIMDAARARRDHTLQSGRHPFHRAAPSALKLNAWAVLIEDGGHQIPHFHPRAWLSGVYYVDVPSEIRSDDPERNEWVIFGRSESRWYRPGTAVEEFGLCPEPGLLVTFPSFFWHRTNAMKSARRRISYAFDIAPA